MPFLSPDQAPAQKRRVPVWLLAAVPMLLLAGVFAWSWYVAPLYLDFAQRRIGFGRTENRPGLIEPGVYPQADAGHFLVLDGPGGAYVFWYPW